MDTPADGSAAAGGGGPSEHGHPSLKAEVRDAVTVRATVLVVGVALLQLGFIASYLGAFHQPTPHRLPMAVVAPASVGIGTNLVVIAAYGVVGVAVVYAVLVDIRHQVLHLPRAARRTDLEIGGREPADPVTDGTGSV